MTRPPLPLDWTPVRRDPPGPGDLTLTAPATAADTPVRKAALAYLERLRQVAQLAAAGHGYRPIARALRLSPEGVHAMARAGARLLLREGTAPEELRDTLANLPPLEPPPERRPRPRVPQRRRTARLDLDALTPAPGDLDALTVPPDLVDDLAVPMEELEEIAADDWTRVDPDVPDRCTDVDFR